MLRPSTPSRSRVRASRACRTAAMSDAMWWPITSKRNPSTLKDRRPVDDRVHHDPAHHPVLAGGVRAAGAALHLPVGLEAMVVAGHHAVEDRERRLPVGVGVVEDDVQDHPEPRAGQGLDRLTQLHDAGRAVGVGRVAPLHGEEMERVVSPVVAVPVPVGRDEGGLSIGVGREGGKGFPVRLLTLPAVVVHGREVEHGHEVHVGEAGLRQGEKMRHPVGLHPGEGPEGAPLVLAARSRREC